MSWQQIRLASTKQNVESWTEALLSAGALSITLEEDKNQAIYELSPEHHPLWDHMSLIALFPSELDKQAIELQLSSNIDSKTLNLATWTNIAEQDWQSKWKEDLQPMLFGDNLWICPSWCQPPEPSAVNIIIDPEQAFGTGTHPSTAMCLEWITKNIRNGDIVVDYGCGSGILAIAAAKMGAVQVYGTDIDPIALSVSTNNAIKNNISESIFSCYLPENIPEIHADVLIANILSGPLLELAPTLTALLKPAGKLVLSGLLREQADKIQARYAEFCHTFSITTKDEWALISATKRN